MTATLHRLLTDAELGLRLLTPEHDLPQHALAAPVSWVHSSDLVDPTPFLSADQVLLTTGTHFPPDGSDTRGFYEAYVARLRARGIAGLGFGTDVLRSGTPNELVNACRTLGLPLFEVPYRTPFIAVARLAAEISAEDSHARQNWALTAQRAISLAAIRPDGLSATLAELSRQLGCWVALFDAGGALDRVFPEGALPDAAVESLRDDVGRLFRGRNRSSAAVSADGERITLQTLGERGRFRGALALGGAQQSDQASDQVVTSVIALASLALEQNHALDRARGHLRSGLLHMLLKGEDALVAGIAEQMWGPLPEAPVRLAVGKPGEEGLDAAVEYLEVRAQDSSTALFYAVQDDSVVLCMTADAGPAIDALVASLGVRAGISAPHDYTTLADAWREATLALAETAADIEAGGRGVVHFESLSQRGIHAFVGGEGARELGRAILRPLLDHDAADGSALLAALRVWLANNGQFEAAAQELGVHRHTLRAWIARAEQLLARDLSTFQTRAELWTALVATEGSPSGFDA